jgi:hypothetical protein
LWFVAGHMRVTTPLSAKFDDISESDAWGEWNLFTKRQESLVRQLRNSA